MPAGRRGRASSRGMYLLQDVEVEEQVARAAARLRHHPARSRGGRGAPGKRLGRRRRRLERDQLHRAAARRPRRRALEPAASRSEAARPVRRASAAGQAGGPGGRRERLHQDASPTRSARSCRRTAPTCVLGTDGFGRSDSRAKLRYFFEVNRHFVDRRGAEVARRRRAS